jgi:hypothetical protein
MVQWTMVLNTWHTRDRFVECQPRHFGILTPFLNLPTERTQSMCGIFGIIISRPQRLGPTLIESGKRLAYRGYNSVGCATVAANGTIDLRKGAGRIEDVSAELDFAAMRGLRGMT